MILKTTLVDNHIEGTESFIQKISFEELVTYLTYKIQELDEHERTFPTLILDRIQLLQSEKGTISLENHTEFEEIFSHIYYLTSNILRDEEIFWGLGCPIPNKAIYGQANFYDLLDGELELVEERLNTPLHLDFDFSNKLLYMIVLQQLYNLPVLHIKQLYHKKVNGVSRYYQLRVDFSFVKVESLDSLPLLNTACFSDKEIKNFSDFIPLLKSIDLKKFSFNGFTILKFIDVTNEHVNDKINTLISHLPSTDIISDISTFDRTIFWREMKEMIYSIANSSKVYSSFFPLLELNGYPVVTSDLGKDSIFFTNLLHREKEMCQNTIFSYLKDPYTITYGVSDGFDLFDQDLISHLKGLGLVSYVCFPLKYKGNIVGFLELYSKEERIERKQLVNVASFLHSFSNLAMDMVATFKNSMDKVILDKFTALQEAVQWKFNDAAANYLNDISVNKQDIRLDDIRFEKVYPIYGAVDVRNSTKLRNIAYKKDTYQRIGLLQLMVDQMEATVLNEEEEKFIQRFNIVKGWLDNGQVDYYLLDILFFFHEDVKSFLLNLNSEDIIVQKIKKQYLEENVGNQGVVDGASEQFEVTLQSLNDIISKELQLFNNAVQEMYPSYFEKFRTDGIEYDMYVGQSISPSKIFNESILRDIRKKQIASMVMIARKTYAIIDDLPISLVTTQLIFVHPNSIDISFRQDERRFDVEGGYNIRYEVIKKRIDKALVKGSTERLVQPNKIAVVYSSNRVEHEIQGILDELVQEKLIEPDYESLVLDELQGIEELRAFRVTVLLES